MQIAESFEDLDEQVVVDLGCGTVRTLEPIE